MALSMRSPTQAQEGKRTRHLRTPHADTLVNKQVSLINLTKITVGEKNHGRGREVLK